MIVIDAGTRFLPGALGTGTVAGTTARYGLMDIHQYPPRSFALKAREILLSGIMGRSTVEDEQHCCVRCCDG